MPGHVHSRGFLLLIFMFTICESEEGTIRNFQRREHSLIKPYQGSGLGMPHWDFLGSTMVTNSYIRLTPDEPSKFGAIWNNVPCQVGSWELHVQFRVHGSGQKLFGDGLAIWYTKERMTPGPVFGNADLFTGLAIILDTYNNHKGPRHHNHPYISAMVNNGNVKYDHETDGTHTQLGGCESQFRGKSYETYVAIRYESETITVSMDINNMNSWKKCFSVSEVKLPVGYFFGVSAVTGELTDNHDITYIRMYDLDTEEDRLKIPPQHADLPETLSDTGDVSMDDDNRYYFMGSWGKLLALSSLLVVGVGGCIVAGIIFFQKQQENSRKRFY